MEKDYNDISVELTSNEQGLQRRKKLQELRKRGWNYPNNFRCSHSAQQILDNHGQTTADELLVKAIEVQLAGRIISKRVMGKASFLHLQDASGKIQLYVKSDELGEQRYQDFLDWDLGDIIGVVGSVFKTKSGELSVKVAQLSLLTKSLLPLPEKFHGLTDQEIRSRQRYLDLIVNEESRRIFQLRSGIITAMRKFFNQQGFLEVETPMMHPIPGGAAARPFITYHNALDMTLYLRIAPELYLKRLVVGGLERVFEINRNFRNEGISTRHNPEFTMVEFYQAYADYHDLMDFTEVMLRFLATEVLGHTQLTYQGKQLDLAKPYRRLTMQQAIMEQHPFLTRDSFNHLDQLRQAADKLKITITENDSLAKIQTEIFEKTVEKELIEPTFITEYPAELSPLARPNDINPSIADRFEFFVGGREIANGFSELNDSELQASIFREQAAAFDRGDQEAMHYDEDYITALEYGLPPTAGEGIGIDRLIMLFTNAQSIREVILFPLMRPLNHKKTPELDLL